MTRPDALSKKERLFWSTGSGTDVWAMFCAAKNGDLETIKSLLQKDASLVRGEFEYRTPMAFAVQENQLEAAAYLLAHKASPVKSGTDDTLIQIARDRGYGQMQQLLESAMAQEKGSWQGNEIADAIRHRSFERVEHLLNVSEDYLHARDDSGNQPIHWAVMSRQPDMISLLLSKGADIHAQRPDGARPIQLTNGDYAYRGWRDVPEDAVKPHEIYKILLAHGAYLDICMASLKGDEVRVRELLNDDPSLANRVSDYVSYYPGSGAPLKNAAMAGHINIVKLLLDNGADPNLPEEGIAPKGHALHSAVVYGHHEIVKLLLDHGACPNVPIESSADTLSAAISREDKAMVELLCSYGAAREIHLLAYYGDIQTAAAVFAANPEKANDPEALENAASEGNDSFVRLMLRYQPELPKRIAVGVKSSGPDEPTKSRELSELLFQHGMNPNYTNWLNVRPMHRFAKSGDLDNAAIFISHGAEINVVDDELCSTPLGWAAKYGKTEMVRFLLEKGDDPNLPIDKTWAQPISWAKSRGHHEIVSVLEAKRFV